MKLNSDLLKNQKVIFYIVLVLVIGIISGIWYKFQYLPLQERLKTEKAKLDAKNKELEAIRDMMKSKIKLENDIKQKELILVELKKMFPEKKEIANLIFEITKTSRFNNVMLTKFIPAGDVVKDYYIENKYMLTVKTNYHKLGDFLASLANLKLLINVDKINISAVNNIVIDEDIDPATLDETLTSSFELTTFSSKEE